MEKIKRVAHLKGSRGFEMDLGGHNLITDAPKELGGDDAGPSPKQLLLAGLIGCIGIDITSIGEKKKLDIEDIQIEVEADVTDTQPSVYENIHLTFKFKGNNLKVETLEKMIALAEEKYCGVSVMLAKHTPITFDVEII